MSLLSISRANAITSVAPLENLQAKGRWRRRIWQTRNVLGSVATSPLFTRVRGQFCPPYAAHCRAQTESLVTPPTLSSIERHLPRVFSISRGGTIVSCKKDRVARLAVASIATTVVLKVQLTSATAASLASVLRPAPAYARTRPEQRR
jgi:hypothetical protein